MDNIKASDLRESLTEQYKMNARVFPLGQDVFFFGTKEECINLQNKKKDQKSNVDYSVNMQTWYVCFPYWFDLEFSQLITRQ